MCSIASSANLAWSATGRTYSPKSSLTPSTKRWNAMWSELKVFCSPSFSTTTVSTLPGPLGDRHGRPSVLVDERAELGELRVVTPSGHRVLLSACGGPEGTVDAVTDFLTDIKTLRERAREKIEQGPITSSYGADRDRVIEVLNEALATEIVCVLRYKRHYYMADGLNAGPVAAEFLQHANEELGHADQIALRITQLQGEPNFNPDGITDRSHAEYVEGETLVDMIKEDLVAERIAIESYSEIIRWLGDKDTTTRRLMEEILAVEEEHADDLLSLLADLDT